VPVHPLLSLGHRYAVALVALLVVALPGAAWSVGPTNVTGTISTNTTWTLTDSPYVMTGNVTVAAGVTLTIEPGVVVEGNSASRQLTVNGALTADGTSGSRITFTSSSDTASGQWVGIKFAAGSGTSSLKFVDARYGGGGGLSDANGMVEISGGTVTIEDSTFTNSSVSGLRINGGTTGAAATVTVRRSKFEKNGFIGGALHGDGLSGLNANMVIEDSAFWQNAEDGIESWVNSSYAQSPAQISGSSIWDNEDRGVYLYTQLASVAGLAADGHVAGKPGNAVYDNGDLSLAATDSWEQLVVTRASTSVDWAGTYWGPARFIPCPLGSTTGHVSYSAPDPNPNALLPVERGPVSRSISASGSGASLVWCGNDDALVNEPAYLQPNLHFNAPASVFGGIPIEHTRCDCDPPQLLLANPDGVINTHRPVNTASGGLIETATDLKLAGPGILFAWTRTYNSKDTASGALGVGWTHPFAASLTVVNPTTGELEYLAGSGQRVRFTKTSGGATGAATYAGKAFDGTLKRLAAGSYELVSRDRRTLAFDSAGLLTQIKPRFLPATTLNYTSGKLSSITDSAGRTITISYNATTPALIERVTLHDGRYVEYGYTSGRLTSVRDPRAKIWTLSYHATSGLLTGIQDPVGRYELQDVVYDAQGRVTSEEDGAGEAITYSYSTSSPYELTTVTYPGRGSWVYKHLGNLVVGVTDPLNRTTQYGYDAYARKATETDGRGNTWRYHYDAYGNLLKAVAPSPAGFTIERTFNSTNDVLTEKDGRGNTTSYAYATASDAAADYQVGQLKTVTDRENGVSTPKYWTSTSSPTPAAAVVGQLKSSTDQRSKTTSFAYDTDGNLNQITSPLGRKTTMGYDGSGRLTSRRDPRGNVPVPASGYLTQWTYDAVDHIATTTDARGNVTTFDYYDNELLWKSTVTDRGSTPRVTTLEYDSDNRLWKTTDPRSGAETRLYWPDGKLKSVETAAGSKTSYEYDNAGQLWKLVEPKGNAAGATASDYTWTYGYDAAGNRTTESHPDGGERETFYDELNRPYQWDDPLEHRTSVTYDNNDNLTSRTNALNKTRIYTYDKLNRLLTETDERSKTTTREYWPTGQLKSVTSDLGHKTTFALDDDGRFTSMVEPRGNAGGATPSDYTWTYAHDEAGNRTSVTDPLGNEVEYTYDAVNGLTQVEDQRGNATNYAYDVLNRLWKVTPPAAGATGTLYTEYVYDAAGNLASRTDPNGNATTWTYDLDGRTTSRTTPVGTWNYDYDENGNLTALETAAGSSTGTVGDGTITYGYDRMNRLTSTDYSDSTPDVTRTYDLAGRPDTMVDGSGTLTYTHDNADRLTAIARTGGGSGLNGTLSYEYDDAGNITSRTLPDSSSSTYGFDDDGRLTTITSAGATTTLAYDAAGNLTSTTLPSGNGYVETRSFDRAGRLTAVDNSKAATILSRHASTLDAAGNPTRVQTTRGATDVYDAHEYDARNRLTASCFDIGSSPTDCTGAANEIGYAYDKVNNRTQETRVGSVPNPGTTDYTYNSADQLTSSLKSGVTTTYSYDGNGNQTAAGARTFTYDLADRLVSTASGGTTTSYAYDGDGRRVSSSTGGADLRYVWDPLAPSGIPELALERDSSGTLVRRYLTGPRGALNYTTSSATYWYHRGPLDTVTDVTNASGTAQWRYQYDAYGGSRSAVDVSGSAPENRFRFNGQYLDPETTNYHLRARQYDPATGRFGALDPLENPVLDPYATAYGYVNGRPTALVDPLGLFGNPFGGLVDMVSFYGNETKDAVVDVAHEARDAYRERGGGVDGVLAAVDAVNPVADAARSAKRTYDEAGGGWDGVVAVADAVAGVTDMVAAARACAGGDSTACLAVAASAAATLCAGPFSGRLVSKTGTRAAGRGRGLNNFGGVVSETGTNAAGGRVFTSTGTITQDDFAGIVDAALMRGDDVHILTGAHGSANGKLVPDASMHEHDVARFGDYPGVTVHDVPSMTSDAIHDVLQRPGTIIGGFCDSAACLAPYK
jgi:RHS repeat-associated protein